MKMGNKWLRNAAAVAVSAATLLAFGAVGAGTAVADDTNLDLTTMYNTGKITITKGTPGHTYKALQLGKYAYATHDVHDPAQPSDTTKMTSLSVDSLTAGGAGDVDKAVYKAADKAEQDRAAAVTPTPETPKTVPSDNAIGWVEQNWVEDSSTTHAGMLRNFVMQLDKQTAISDGMSSTSTPSQTVADNGDAVFENLPIGVYLVEDTSSVSIADPSKPSNSDTKTIPILVGTTVGTYDHLNAEELGKIEAKNKVPDISKTYDGVTGDHTKTAVVGDKLDFTINTKVPVYTNYATYKFEIHDQAGDGLSNISDEAATPTYTVDNLKVTIGGIEITAGPTTYTVEVTEHGFVIKFVNIMNYTIDDAIVVTYDMKLVDTAKDTGNTAWLVHSGDPGIDCKKPENAALAACKIPSPHTPPAGPKNWEVTIYNVLKDDTSPAFGAKYTVYKVDGTTETQLKFGPASEKTLTGYTAPAKAYAYGYNASGSVEELGVSDGSAIRVSGLQEGTYKFVQTNAASGQQGTVKPTFTVKIAKATAPNNSNFDFTADLWNLSSVKGDGEGLSVNKADTKSYDFDVQVKNVDSLSNLPMTGGAGILLVVLLALVLSGVAVGTTVLRRRDMADDMDD
ncbi:isopeptide-forming domain-containing fimbrial protein [Bifidobacterium sp. ESL0800]|uniref:isopeptide-forming domain-containing fimbrial protein n=1 Tax=Bifidobacterium sp. ESL0800 TaxID=2983236 RepID=UPI0023F9BF3B|nr:isopeptide-forming domain-containing fimbrial protein [Bifidobacterium sp. ESL0800]WEV75790.1 isopeptide-forming domain-containing fimbrial protein [Bifidobacterium sp. ESL0800]